MANLYKPTSDPMDTPDNVTQGGGMMKRMVNKNGPVAGKKEFFKTLQKQGRIRSKSSFGKKVI